MTDKSKALELAEWLEGGRLCADRYSNSYREAASELRRLDAVERESKARIAVWRGRSGRVYGRNGDLVWFVPDEPDAVITGGGVIVLAEEIG